MTESNYTNNLNYNDNDDQVIEPTVANSNAQRHIILNYEASYLGLMEYNTAVKTQQVLGKLAKTKNQVSVIGLQHPAVITLGRRADETTELLLNHHASTIPILRSSRGGLATLHSEGQLVIYPILNLKHFKLGVRDYVHLLLLTTRDLLQQFGIPSTIDLNGAGVFTSYGKISFCGIEVHEGITGHGISLNVRNDLTLFQIIRSCGVRDLNLDSLAQHQVTDTLGGIFQKWSTCFQANLISRI